MITYANVLKIVENTTQKVYVPVFYAKGTHEWLAIDKAAYVANLKLISNLEQPFPCLVEVERDGEIFFHPKIENT